jgi:hypothetical protein
MSHGVVEFRLVYERLKILVGFGLVDESFDDESRRRVRTSTGTSHENLGAAAYG